MPEHPALVRALLDVLSNETRNRAAFSLALLRHVAAEPEVAESLRDLFLKNGDTNPAFACHLVWRVLDDPQLSLDWHHRLFEYILDHWNIWKLHIAEFEEPGPREMINVIEHRLSDPTYPASKKWIYLLCLPDGLAVEGVAAKGIVTRQTGSSDRPSAHVAKEIFRRFWA